MGKEKTGMRREIAVFKGLAVRGLTARGLGRAGMGVALIVFLAGVGPAVAAQEATPAGKHAVQGEKNAVPSDAEITRPSDPTEALMDAYNQKMQRVMEQADPFYAKDPAKAYSAAEALKNNKEYTKALELYLKLAAQTSDPEAFSGAAEAAQGAGLNDKAIELADEALARYEKQYEAMLTKAKAYNNQDKLSDARIMIEKALETMGENGTGIDAAVMDLYKEIMQKTSGNPEVETP